MKASPDSEHLRAHGGRSSQRHSERRTSRSAGHRTNIPASLDRLCATAWRRTRKSAFSRRATWPFISSPRRRFRAPAHPVVTSAEPGSGHHVDPYGWKLRWSPSPPSSAPRVVVVRGVRSSLAGGEVPPAHRLCRHGGIPAFSPDGKSVAFVSDSTGSRQIWVRLLTGGPPLQITTAPASISSPGGRRIPRPSSTSPRRPKGTRKAPCGRSLLWGARLASWCPA